jgi:hypothetical protein
MVSSIGEAANRSASAQRRTADLVGISPTARLDGNTELAAFRRGRQRGPGRSIPPVKLRSKTSSALRTTVEPIVGWRTGRKGEPAPKRFGAAEKATLDDLAERRRADRGVSAPRRARRCEVDAARRSPNAQLEENARSEVFRTDEKAASESCSVGDARSPRRHDTAARPNPMRWTRGRGAKGKPDPTRFDAAVNANPEYRAERQTPLPKRFGANGEAFLRGNRPRGLVPRRSLILNVSATRSRQTRGRAPGNARPGLVPERVPCRARTAPSESENHGASAPWESGERTGGGQKAFA